MAYITPNQVSTKVLDTKQKRKLFDEALMEVGLAETIDKDGVTRKNLQRLVMSIWNDALYAESPKDRAMNARMILERVGGKPTVMVEEEHEEIPEIVIRTNSKTANQIQDNANQECEEEYSDDFEITVEGEPGRLLIPKDLEEE